jgi:hypothetical protein
MNEMLKSAKTIFLLLLLVNFNCFAGSRNIAGNLVYAELLGKGGYGSINYERLVLHNDLYSAGLRIGVGTYNIRDFEGSFNPDLIIPVSLHLCFFRPHSFETGIGNTFSSIVHVDQSGWHPVRYNRMSVSSFLGYRYNKTEGGVLFRAGYMPVLEFYRRFVHWGGISFGYSF